MWSTMKVGKRKHSTAISLSTTKSMVLCSTKEDISEYLIAKSIGVQGRRDVMLVRDTYSLSWHTIAMLSETILDIRIVNQHLCMGSI